MYLNHWHLDRKPFEPALEGESLYPTQSHQEALCKIRYVLENPRGAAMLTGPSGVGKTLLVDRLVKQLPNEVPTVVRVSYPQMSPHELLSYLAGRLAGETLATRESRPVDQSWGLLESTLAATHERGERPLVVVEEAHLLEEVGLIETIRLLLNLQLGGTPLVTLLLVGQPSLVAALARNPRLEERIDIAATLEPLSPEETAGYIDHRTSAVGGNGEIFTPEACESLHYHAAGIPRRLNRLADLALVIGFAQRASQIDASLIDSVANDLSLPRAA